jgi:GT2 family glycosyltransferase
VSDAPFASIIVPAYFSQATIARSLDSLTGQSFRDFELIVVDSSYDDRSESIVQARFPQVRYQHSSRRLLPHEARNHGVGMARGRILVFTDPDCVAEPDWLERLAAHHRDGRTVVGGAMVSVPGWWNRGVHANKFAWWLPTAKAGQRSELPSGNFSVSREVWDAIGGFRETYFAGDSEICWRIREAGHQIWFDPLAAVTHLEQPKPRAFMRERFRRGQDFGRMRVSLHGWGRLRCLAYLLAAPILPWVMMARSAAYALEGGYLPSWMVTVPVEVAGNGLWCLGEACSHAGGLLRGSGAGPHQDRRTRA